MIYHKTSINDEIEIRLPVYDDELFCICPGCGKEVELDSKDLIEILKDGDFAGTSVYCKDCSKKIANN